MGETRSADGRYWAIDQGDRNFVVYDTVLGVPAFDRWSWEQQQGGSPPAPPIQDPPGTSQTPTGPSIPPAPPAPSGPISGAGQAIRVTNEQDGELLNRMYSYWSNAVVSDAGVLVFAGHADGRPRFFLVNLVSGEIQRLGPRVHYTGTGEGWYFDAHGWLYLLEGPRLRLVHPITGEDRIVFDIEGSHPGCVLWQAHSSDDGQTHSATVKRVVAEGSYPALGTVVSRHGQLLYFPTLSALDESQIDRSGRWVIIKEDNDNRIIELDTRETRLLRQNDGAVGHSDCGPGFVVGEDDAHGACVLWRLDRPLTEGNRRELFHTWNLGHVSVRAGRCLHSDHTNLNLIALDGSGVTPLTAHGMIGSGYDYTCHANLSPCGRVAAWISNAAGRFDLYVMGLP